VNLLRPQGLRDLALGRVSVWIEAEFSRARKRVAALQRAHPSASAKELAQRLIDQKKRAAGLVGGVSGMFGLFSIPADVAATTWLEWVLLVDIATLHGANLKSERERDELLDLFSGATGMGPMTRASPATLGRVMSRLLRSGRWGAVGRTLPLVAAPVTAYLHQRQLQSLGDQAVRHYQGFERVRHKASRARTAAPSEP